MDKSSELEHAVISLVIDTQKLYADQTAEHSLEWTKCPAGRNFHQNATESFLETYREYKILNMRYRNVKPFQKLFGTIFPNILKYILPGCRLPVRSQMDQMPYSQEFFTEIALKTSYKPIEYIRCQEHSKIH